MTDDIVARLRGLKPETPILTILKWLIEAADRLEAAEARVRELEAGDWPREVARYKSYAESFDEENARLRARLSTIEAETIERCAKVAEGDVYKERYRTWPWWGPGNQSADSEITKFADSLAAAIRNLAQEERHAKAD